MKLLFKNIKVIKKISSLITKNIINNQNTKLK